MLLFLSVCVCFAQNARCHNTFLAALGAHLLIPIPSSKKVVVVVPICRGDTDDDPNNNDPSVRIRVSERAVRRHLRHLRVCRAPAGLAYDIRAQSAQHHARHDHLGGANAHGEQLAVSGAPL